MLQIVTLCGDHHYQIAISISQREFCGIKHFPLKTTDNKITD